MNKKLLIFAAGLALLLIVATTLYRQLGSSVDTDNLGTQEQEQQTQEATLAPDFTVSDGNSTFVNLSDFRGKPVVVNFWATWCGYCVQEMPAFEEVYHELGDEIHFMMINSTDSYRETVEAAKDFIEDAGYTFPVYYDVTSGAKRTYGAYSLPMTFFFDAEGHCIAQATGAIDKETLLRGIAMITP